MVHANTNQLGNLIWNLWLELNFENFGILGERAVTIPDIRKNKGEWEYPYATEC